MPKGSNQKYKIPYLLQIMLDKTDSEHSLTMNQIISELDKCGVSAERKTLYEDLQELEKFGVVIDSYDTGRIRHYFVAERSFELAELKLLVDAIQSSKFISERKSRLLIGKLEKLASNHEARLLQRQVYVQGRVKTMNESIYYVIDALQQAIYENRKIAFKYFNWNIYKKMELRRNGALYKVSPWALVWDNENYYLVAYENKEDRSDETGKASGGGIKHFRVDKMLHIEITDEPREGKEFLTDFDAAQYTKKSFGMYDGPEQTVRLLIDNSKAGLIIDRFGKDISFIPNDGTSSFVNVPVAVSRQFLSWIFALGDGVEIVGPDSVRAAASKFVGELAARYGTGDRK